MQKLSIEDIINNIKSEVLFEAVSTDHSFSIKIDDYAHYVCAAVHDGHQFREELLENCTHSEYERWYEEDPATKQMIQTHPIVIAGMDSRFEYDLNRHPDNAIYEDAWGKELWHQPLPGVMKQKSLEKHYNFYRVVNTLISKIEEKHSECLVFDMHSYNWKRWDREVPTWNIGTANIDNNRFEDDVEKWRYSLSEMKLPREIISTSKVNDTFVGNGYFLKYITEHFKNTLVLATEVSKIYCDEYKYELYPDVIDAIENELKERIPIQALAFKVNN